jgi:hypothetical protein
VSEKRRDYAQKPQPENFDSEIENISPISLRSGLRERWQQLGRVRPGSVLFSARYQADASFGVKDIGLYRWAVVCGSVEYLKMGNFGGAIGQAGC